MKKIKKIKTNKIYSEQFEKFYSALIAMFQAFFAAFPLKVRFSENFTVMKASIYEIWDSEKKFKSLAVWFGIMAYLASSKTDTWAQGGFTFGFPYLQYCEKRYNGAKQFIKTKYCKNFREFFNKACPEINGKRRLSTEKILADPRDWAQIWTGPK